MPSYGFADKYSAVGWKATVPEIQETTDVIAISGDKIYELQYHQITDSILALKLEPGRVKKIPDLVPQITEGGGFDSIRSVLNEKEGMLISRYNSNAGTYGMQIWKSGNRQYGVKQHANTCSGIYPTKNNLRHLWEDYYLLENEVNCLHLSSEHVGYGYVRLSKDNIELPDMSSLSTWNRTGCSLPATMFETTNIIPSQGPGITLIPLTNTDIYYYAGNYYPSDLWWIPQTSDRSVDTGKALRIRCLKKLSAEAYTEEWKEWIYPESRYDHATPGWTTYFSDLRKVKCQAYLQIGDDVIPLIDSVTGMSACHYIWGEVNPMYSGDITFSIQGFGVFDFAYGQTGSSGGVPQYGGCKYYLNGNILMLQFKGITNRNSPTWGGDSAKWPSKALAPSTSPWKWDSYNEMWSVSTYGNDAGSVLKLESDCQILESGSGTQFNVRVNLLTKEVSVTRCALASETWVQMQAQDYFEPNLCGIDELAVTIPRYLESRTATTMSLGHNPPSPPDITLVLSDIGGGTFTGSGRLSGDYIEYNTIVASTSEIDEHRIRVIQKTQNGIYVIDAEHDPESTIMPIESLAAAEITQIPLIYYDPNTSDWGYISMPATTQYLDLKSDGMYMNRLLQTGTLIIDKTFQV